MSVTMTATAIRPTQASSMLFSTGTIASGSAPTMCYKKGEDDATVLVLEGVPVFRSGTFRDSMGYQTTWEPLHIDQMVSHFDLLRDRRLFDDVPVRDGHEAFFVAAGGSHADGSVIGYHTGLRSEVRTSLHDGKEYTYLVADFEVIDPKAQEAVRSGLWRNLSAEVGPYVTNDEAEFWPVYSGVAYVDRPAVEGLKAFSQSGTANTQHLFMEEESMTASTNQGSMTPPEVPTPKTPEPGQDSKASVFEFSIGTKKTADPAVVQAYIGELEARNAAFALAAKEQEDAARSEFVTGLSESGRILASALDGTLAFAASLTADQFSAWKATMEALQPAPVLNQYSPGAPPPATPDGARGATEEQCDTLRGVIQQHQRSGMRAEQIKQTDSYKRLKTLDPAFEL